MTGTKEFFRTLHHKKWVRIILYCFINIFLPGIGFYMMFIETRWVQITRLRIPNKKLQANQQIRIVQISDLHFGPTNDSKKYFSRCVEKINNLHPEAIVLTGDFLQWDESYIQRLAHILSHLKAPLGIYAILGNHDYGVCHRGHPPTDPIDYRKVIQIFQEKGIRVLHNESVVLRHQDVSINLVGLGDFWTPFFQPKVAFWQLDSALATILLSHNPDTVHALKNYDFDLMLAGHVHGGQISLPLIGPLVVPVKFRNLRRGLHQIDGHWLYTNRGLGYTLRARLLSRPEITCIELVGV